jgi:4-hydroxybenzoate polyprenyltransferase
MVDREDDLKVGIKSTAILFGDMDRHMIAVLQTLTVMALLLVGMRFGLGLFFYLGLSVAAALFVYQQKLIRERQPEACFRAFLNNNWVGAAVFAGLFVELWASGVN